MDKMTALFQSRDSFLFGYFKAQTGLRNTTTLDFIFDKLEKIVTANGLSGDVHGKTASPPPTNSFAFAGFRIAVEITNRPGSDNVI
ncbi:MAG: hypothetical protein P8K83_05900 [Woeseiaceae bacterium]|nr:hypothetical protein [Woeseiaceae bacterium]